MSSLREVRGMQWVQGYKGGLHEHGVGCSAWWPGKSSDLPTKDALRGGLEHSRGVPDMHEGREQPGTALVLS